MSAQAVAVSPLNAATSRGSALARPTVEGRPGKQQPDPRSVLSGGSRARVIAGPQWLMGGDLVVPLRVDLAVLADETFGAVEPRTGIFGVGPSVAESIMDLRQALVDHRELLTQCTQLSVGLQEQLDILDRHLRHAQQ